MNLKKIKKTLSFLILTSALCTAANSVEWTNPDYDCHGDCNYLGSNSTNNVTGNYYASWREVFRNNYGSNINLTIKNGGYAGAGSGYGFGFKYANNVDVTVETGGEIRRHIQYERASNGNDVTIQSGATWTEGFVHWHLLNATASGAKNTYTNSGTHSTTSQDKLISLGKQTGRGDVEINNSGTMSGATNVAILTSGYQSGHDLRIINSGTISSANGITYSQSGGIDTCIHGSSAGCFENSGDITATAEGGYAIKVDGSNNTLGITGGTIIGKIVENGTQSGNVVKFNSSSDLSFGATIENNFALTKTGSGYLTLTGANTYSGTTTVSQGTLYAGNSSSSGTTIIAGNVTVAGGSLGGGGTIGGNVTVSSGKLTPGNSIGTTTISGDLTVNSGTTTEIEISPSSNDKIIINGDIALDGTINIRPASGTYSAGTYTLIDGSGGIGNVLSGTFNTESFSDASRLAGFLRSISYDTVNRKVILTLTNARTSYTLRITGKLNKILQVLENINTNSLNSSLTTALDNLSDVALEKVASQINGVTVKRILGNGAKKHSTFKRALSKVTSLNTGSVASSTTKNSLVSSLTKNNYGALSINDLENNGLYISNQNRFGPANTFTDFDFKSLVNIYKNKNLFSIDSENSSFFVRTFAEVSDQNKVGSEVGYNSNSGGILLGKKNKINEKKEQGWALGFSLNSSDFDENYGNNDSQTIHASIYQVEDFEKYSASINLGTFVTRGVLDRKVTEGVSQTLNSKNFDVGFDATATLSKKINLINNWQINPSVSFNTTYIIQDDINESGGDLALDVKTNNLLIAKPELGFDLNKVFIDTETRNKQFNFSLYGSLESKLDGTTSNAKIKDTGSTFNIIDNNKDDKFVSLGIGYTDFNKENNKEHTFSLFRTKNEHGNLNSTLLSYTFKQNF